MFRGLSGSLFSRLNLPTNYSGLGAFASAVGNRSCAILRVPWQTLSFKDIPGLAHFGPGLTLDPSHFNDFLGNMSSTKPGYYTMSLLRTSEGYGYTYRSSDVTLSPEAQKVVREMKGGFFGLMALNFAAGDSYLIRPADAMTKYPSDFAYTVAMAKAGTIPNDALVQLASSQIRLSDVQMVEKNGELSATVLAKTDAAHLFGPDGRARWTFSLTAEGKMGIYYSGSGRPEVCGFAAANSGVAGPLWDTTSVKTFALVESIAKDPALLDKVTSVSEMRVKISAKILLANRINEVVLRVMDGASRPFVSLKKNYPEWFAGEPMRTHDDASEIIDGVLKKPDLGSSDVIDADERNALADAANDLRESGQKPEAMDPKQFEIFDSSGGDEFLPDPSGDPNSSTGDPSDLRRVPDSSDPADPSEGDHADPPAEHGER
jgi:hypothetical protein